QNRPATVKIGLVRAPAAHTSSPSPRPDGDDSGCHCQNGRTRMSDTQVTGNCCLLDEIFQARDPVLVGVDAASTFCFLLSPEEHRDADTWGIRLLELVDRGFAPKATVADFGSGLRAGHQEALPEVPCRGDVFHALYDVGPLVRYLENRAYETIDTRTKLERKQATAERRHGRKDQS